MADSDFRIPITKAGKGSTLTVTKEEIAALSDGAFAAIVAAGLKVMLNANMSKFPTKDLDGDELSTQQAKIMEKAAENKAKVLAGEVKSRGATATAADGSKVPGPVMTKARQLAKETVKDELRKAGIRISLVAPTDITAYANKLLADDPSYIAEATKLIEETKAKAADKGSVIARLAELGISESPILVQKAEKAKAAKAKDKPVSAKQAAKPKAMPVPAKPQHQPHTTH